MADVNLTLQAFMLIIMSILMVAALVERRVDSHVPTPLLSMMIMDIVMLVMNILYIILGDEPVIGPHAAMALSIISHALYYLIFFAFLYYLKNNFTADSPGDRRVLIAGSIVYAFCFLLWLRSFLAPVGSPLEMIFISYRDFLLSFMTLLLIVRCRENLTMQQISVLISIVAIPFLAALIHLFYPSLYLASLSLSLAVLLIYAFVHLSLAYRIKQQELELSRASMAAMLGQIQPHFLYNTLNSIYVLCESDPAKAQEAIGDFSEYLRANLKATDKALITIDEEMSHVKHYVSLQQIRFEEKLSVVTRHQCHGFLIPPLSVQTLVENAIRHGLAKKPEGGTVFIRTYEDASDYYVSIRDDGIGFDPEHPPENRR